MPRLCFHLLLMFSLVFNAVAAPWAMAGMHDSPASHDAADTSASRHASHLAGAPRHPAAPGAGHQHHAHHGMQVSDHAPTSQGMISAVPPEAAHSHPGHTRHVHDHADKDQADKDCCNGTTCECGCVLPPAVPLTRSAVPSPCPAVPHRTIGADSIVAVRGSPPFRPPAA